MCEPTTGRVASWIFKAYYEDIAQQPSSQHVHNLGHWDLFYYYLSTNRSDVTAIAHPNTEPPECTD